MRIGLVTPGFSASERDWCIPALLDLVRRLAVTDEVTVYALRYPHTRTPYEVHGARVVPFGAAQRRGLGRLGLWHRASKALRAAAPDLDVLHGLWAHEPGWLATRAGRATATPVVVSLMGGELENLPELGYGGQRGAINRHLIRRALADADQVTAGSAWLADRVAPRLRHRPTVLPLGVETRRFAPSPGPPLDDAPPPALDGTPAIVHSGSLVPVKDHATLLDAFARLHTDHPEAVLHLLGEGSLRQTLEERARALGLARAVRFHGNVDHGALPPLLRAADLCVLSSRFESQCLAVLEAAACGCPVAGTTVGVLPELGPDVPTAPPGDAEALAGAMGTALARDRRATGAGLGATVRRRFGLDVTVPRLRALYASLSDRP